MNGTRAPLRMHVSEIGDGISVEEVIGSGAMALLLRGRRRSDGREVAVKVLLPKHMSDPDIAERFVREGEATAELESPYLPEILGLGTTESDQPYIVMELLKGRDLQALLADKASVPVRDVARYVVEACEGVAVAHAAGIVHRDIKPSNLFLANLPDGTTRIKVLDFGIAKLAQNRTHRRTSVQTVLGTSQYMSPEQIRSSAAVDARSDVWSLGVVLFELLTRQVPFDEASTLATMSSILDDPTPRFSTMFGEMPDELVAIVEKCLQKNSANRYATVRDLADALRPFTQMTEEIGPLFVVPSHESSRPITHTRQVSIGMLREEPLDDGEATLPESEDVWLKAMAETRPAPR